MVRQDHFLTVREFAQYWGISDHAVRQRIRRGQIPIVRLGRSIYIPKNTLEQLPVYRLGGAR
jgi:excisionase family DNA binding protein